MSDLKISIPHTLSNEEASNRIKGLLSKVKEEHKDKVTNLKEEWEGDTGSFSFTAQGFDLAGLIQVNPSSVDFNAKLPFALSFFKGKITEMITKKASELLS